MLCQYLVLLHSPDTCSSSSSGSDAMRMRVLAAFAAARPSLHDLLLNKTLLSLFLFILPLPAIAGVSALAACHRATPWTLVVRELPGAPSALCVLGASWRAFIATETPPVPHCTSQATRRL